MCVLSRQYVTAETLTRHEPMSGREYLPFVRPKARFAGQKAQEHSFVRRNAVFTGHIAMYRWQHFRQSRLCHHDLHKPLWQADITDGGQQGVSVTPDAIGMRSETTTHGRVWREMPRAPCPPRHPSVRPACSHSLPVERLLPGPLRHPSLPGVSLFRHFRCYLDRPPALQSSPRHSPLPGVSHFRHFRCYLGRTSGAAERQRVCGANEQQRRPAEACQSPRTRTPPNGLTKKCSSEHRRGRGTLPRQSRKAT